MNAMINRQKIKELAGPTTYARGLEYFQDGMVEKISFNNGILSGEVQGSRSHPYKVQIYFYKKRIHPQCSCPYDWGEYCKHAVALFLAWQKRQADPRQQNAVSFLRERPQAAAEGPSDRPGDDRDLASRWGASYLAALREKKSASKLASANIPPKFSPSSLLNSLHRRYFAQKSKIQIQLSTNRLTGIAPEKGIDIKICYLQDQDVEDISAVIEDLVQQQNDRYREAKSSLLARYTPLQQHYLNFLAALTRDNFYSSSLQLKPFQLSLFLNEFSQDQIHEEIELWDAKRNQPIRIETEKRLALVFRLNLTKKNKLRILTQLDDPHDQQAEAYQSLFPLWEGRPVWFFDARGLRFTALHPAIDRKLFFDFLSRETIIAPEEIPQFLNTAASLQDGCRIIYEQESLKNIQIETASLKTEVYLDYQKNKLFVDLKFIYPQQSFGVAQSAAAREFFPAHGKNGETHLRWLKRDLDSEAKFIKFFLKECLFQLNSSGRLELAAMDAIFDFLSVKLDILQKGKNCEVFYSKSLEGIFQKGVELLPEVSAVSEGINWFHFDVKYRAQGIEQGFSPEEIQRQLLKGKQYIRLEDGKILPINRQAFEKIESLVAEYDGRKLAFFHLPFFMEEAGRQEVQLKTDAALEKLYKEFQRTPSFSPQDVPVCVRNVLREYQHQGVAWLEFLRHFSLGGILADEMGLGKTLQVLSILAKEKEKGVREPSLVVCPTTLVWNWQKEVEKFLPGFKTLAPYGADRRRQMDLIPEADLVVTSYALLRRDVEFYARRNFHYVILDEAQNIKNRNTHNARLSKVLNSRYRLVLTGTPLENSIVDLWSIFDFLMPGFLRSYDKFKYRYEYPISKDRDSAALERLRRKVGPFILRRLKQQVMQELPEKIEQVSFCELEGTQRGVYQEMLKLAQKDVLTALKEKGFVKSQMMILTVILRLRQICCHPQLAGVTLGHKFSISAKLNLLKELLDEALSGGHRVLIFSQFIGMLKIIAEYLNKEKIRFEYMDGQTSNRQEIVERFNRDFSSPVFLLSLKVGGVGLNLTGADTVFLFDPWWNPAVESQAIDRAHRIGQKNAVVAHKFIVKGTIEEKILELQKKKKFLTDSLIVADEDIVSGKLTLEDIKFLLELDRE